MEKRPLVTVFMAMYNGEKYVREAVESVLGQTLKDFELLVIDDGSTDDSMAILQQFSDERIRVLQNEQNMGLFKTRNRAVQEARGEYFAILDCDDIAYPDRLEAPVAFLKAHADYGACFGLYHVIDEHGNRRPSGHMFAGDDEWIRTLMLFTNPFINSASVVSTRLMREYGYRDGYAPSEDYDLFERIAARHKVAILDRKLVKYRIHQSNISNLHVRAGVGHRQVISNLLSQLSLSDDQYVRLHYALYRKELAPTGFQLKDLEDWLLLLQTRNNQLKVYNGKYFRKVLEFEWARLIYHNKGAGELLAFVRSSLFGVHAASYFTYLGMRGIVQRMKYKMPVK